MTRISGLILHPTSLPGRFGIGDLGEAAYQFVDFLAEAKQSMWQILPIGIPCYGASPYQSLSAFAGNPLWLSPQKLYEAGYVSEELLNRVPAFSEDRVDFGAVTPWKHELLKVAYEGFENYASSEDRHAFDEFCHRHKEWLDDFSWYATLKAAHGGVSWCDWPRELALREPQAIKAWKAAHQKDVRYHQFLQYQFFKQWTDLRNYANDRGIKIMGDIPIFVGYDSADVWGHRSLFELDQDGYPTVVAGVPPDYFSATGQRWGNPLYRWGELAKDNYHWWQMRIKVLLELVDIIRIDHFRGFEKYWEIPSSEPTAMKGEWKPGPGVHFFDTLRKALGTLPIVAEDLGVITPEVEKLRDDCGFPGMKVLQFAFFDSNPNSFIPHRCVQNCVMYTGTHDNNTTRGWYDEIPDEAKNYLNRYTWRDVKEHDVAHILSQMSLSSTADTAMAPLQDILNLGRDARMNLPGSDEGNWGWRFRQSDLNQGLRQWLADLSLLYERNLHMF